MKIKGIVIILIIAMVFLSACGKEKVDYRESLLAGIDKYLHNIESNDNAEQLETDIKFVNSVLSQYEGEDKENFVKIAEHMEKGNSSEVKKLYEELNNEK